MTHGAAAGQRGGPQVPLPIGRAGHNEPPQKGLSFLPSFLPFSFSFSSRDDVSQAGCLIGEAAATAGHGAADPGVWRLAGWRSRASPRRAEEGGRRQMGRRPISWGGGTSPRGKGAAQLETRVNSACRRDLEGTLGLQRPRLTPSAQKRVLGGAAAASGGKISPTPLG